MSKQQSRVTQREKNNRWFDSEDMELIFMNSIAICVLLLAIVIAKVFMQ